MSKVLDFLAGKKTYLVAVAIITTAAVAFFNGSATLGDAIKQALEGLGLAALRAGVAKAEPPTPPS